MQPWQSQDLFDQASDFNRLITNITKRSQECMREIINDSLAVNQKQMQYWTRVKKPEEIIEFQTYLWNEAKEQFMDSSRKLANTTLENFADYSKLVELTINAFNPAKLQQFIKPATNSSSASAGKK